MQEKGKDYLTDLTFPNFKDHGGEIYLWEIVNKESYVQYIMSTFLKTCSDAQHSQFIKVNLGNS